MSDSWRPDGSVDVDDDVALDWLLADAASQNGHEGLVSSLSGHDLAFAQAARPPASADALAVDPDDDREPGDVFPQSVASGGPTTTSVILWTRIDPAVFDPALDLGVVVATDDAFADVVYRGVVEDADAVRRHDHTVKVDLDGHLDPDRRYHYRFVYDGVPSRPGRCRTLPPTDASVDDLTLAVLTCQNYANGYYPAYGYVAEEDVDFVVHVGDFVYESDDGAFNSRFAPAFPDREKEFPSGHERVQGLEDYRHLYRTYKRDPFLQAALETHTLLPTWDDHEIANDVHWDYDADAPKADHPRGDDPEFMTELAADAMHAWWEYMPARIEYDPDADRLQDRFRLWRTVQFGDLVSLVLTDERLFRSPPRDVGIGWTGAVGPAHEPEGHSMLGRDQFEWFVEHVDAADDRSTWTVWCDEVLTVPFRVGAGRAAAYPVQGGWDGYMRERDRLSTALDALDVENFVTLTGDMHCYVAGYKQTEYRDAVEILLRGRVPESDRIGVEFMTPALTSLNLAEALGLTRTPLAGPTERLVRWLVTTMNPHIEFFDSHHWGYSVVEFTQADCTYRAYSVDKTENSANADRRLVTAQRVPRGRVHLEDVSDEYALD